MPPKKRSAAAADIGAAVDIGRDMAAATIKRRRKTAATRKRGLQAHGAAALAAGSAGTLIAEGDSWFDYPFVDVLSELDDKYGYEVESVAHRGDTVEDMAYSNGQLDAFARRVEKVLRAGTRPKAILLSGGGNDVAGDEFAILLNHAASSGAGLNEAIVAGVIDQRLQAAYATILSAITAVCQHEIGAVVPIVLHGYDYPVPDGRGFWGGWPLPGPWLEPGFRRKGYEAMARRKQIVVALIDRFNEMLARVAGHAPFAHVHHLDLRRTLSTGADYKDWWDNELHPTREGFEAVTSKLATLLRSL